MEVDIPAQMIRKLSKDKWHDPGTAWEDNRNVLQEWTFEEYAKGRKEMETQAR